MADFIIKRGDTRPAIQGDLSAASSDVITSAVFNMKKADGTVVIDRGACVIVAQPSATSGGTVKYQWVTPDTASAGAGLQAEFEVTFSDGRVETYPNRGFISITITNDIA